MNRKKDLHERKVRITTSIPYLAKKTLRALAKEQGTTLYNLTQNILTTFAAGYEPEEPTPETTESTDEDLL